MKHLPKAIVLVAFFLSACDGPRSTVKDSGQAMDTAPNANATAVQVMEKPVPAPEPVVAVESEQNRRAVAAVPVRSATPGPAQMQEAPIDDTWEQSGPIKYTGEVYTDDTFQQSQEDWSSESAVPGLSSFLKLSLTPQI